MAADKGRFFSGKALKVESSGNIGSTAINVDSTSKNLFVDRQNNLAMIRLSCALTSSIAGTGALIATIPEKYRPQVTREVILFGTYSNAYGAYSVVINPDGTVKTNTGSGNFSGSIRINSTYFI